MAPSADEMGITKGSYDHGDPTTTNLYVGNLAPTVTEEALEVRSWYSGVALIGYQHRLIH